MRVTLLSHGVATPGAGNYDDFKTMHEQKVAKQEKDYEKQQKLVAAMKGAWRAGTWHGLAPC